MKYAAVNIIVQVSESLLPLLLGYGRCGIVGSYRDSVFNFFHNHHIVFYHLKKKGRYNCFTMLC